MKTLYMIGGTMGVGKTTVSRELQKRLPDCVFLDGDWCWDMRPFTVTDETKAMVVDNICHLLNNFLGCTEYKNVIFCWVMHERSIIDSILSRLDTADAEVRLISLVCDEASLRARLQSDVDAGIRTSDVIERSVLRIPLYERLDTEKLDVSHITAARAAEIISGK